MAKRKLSRRTLLRGMAAAGAAGAATQFLPVTKAMAADLTVGFIYVGPRDDFGYNQAHAEGAAALKKLPGITVIDEEKIAETVAVQKSMESMIKLDGAKLIFPTSFGYFDPHVLEVAKKFADVRFEHAGGLWQEGKHPGNVGSYFGFIDEAVYLSGLVAGYTTKSNKLGFIAAKPIPQVLRNINAFTLAAKSVNPNVTTQLIITGDWSLPTLEAESATALIDQGVDVLTMHVDSPKIVVETAEKRGVFVTGYHANQAPLAAKGYLTGAEWNWGGIYTDFAKKAQAGETLPNFFRGGLKEGFVKTSNFGPAVADKARNHAADTKAKMMSSDYVIFKGPIKDNKGKTVIAAGTDLGQFDVKLEEMNYLVEGVIGSIA